MQTISIVRKWLAVGIVLSFVVMSIIPTTGNVAVSDRMNKGNARGSPPDEEWNRTYRIPSKGGAIGNCVQVTPDGGYIVTGYAGYGYWYDVYVLKVDSQGNELWNRTFGNQSTTRWDSGNWVEVTSDHGYIITGRHSVLTSGPSGVFFAFDVNPGSNSVWFDPYNPGVLHDIGSNTAPDFISGGCFANNIWYAVCYSGGLYTVDYTTGEMTLLGGTTPLYGIGYDDSSGTMYGCDSTNLYKVDMTTGATTLVGPFNNTWGCMIDMTIDCDGNAYGHDISHDAIDKINLTTGAATMIGYTGIDCNYAQGMGFDKDNDILYLAAYTTEGEGGLYTVDVATGHATLVGSFQGGDEVDGLAIPYGIYWNSYDEVWLIKTDAHGNEQWNTTYGLGQASGSCVKQTKDGGYIVTGRDADHVFLLKTDASGNETWFKTYENTSGGSSLALTPDGGYIVTGKMNYKLFLMKTDQNGTVEWEKVFFPNAPPYFGSGGAEVQLTSDGGYIVGGTATNDSYSSAMLLMKTDADGNEQWNRTFSGSNWYKWALGYSVIQTVNGDYVLGGTQLGDRLWLIRTHPDGSVVWNRIYVPSLCARCYCVQQTPDTGFIATGAINVMSGPHCLLLKLNAGDNHPPSSSPIEGPHWGVLNENYSFCINATDPDGDTLYCTWDWGDGNSTGWLGPYPPNGTLCAIHAWSQKGTYTITITLRDKFGHESNSSPFYEFYAGESKHAFLFGRYTNMTSDDGFRIIDAVNLRMLLFRPIHYVHYREGEKVAFSINTSRAFITRHFIVGRVDALT